LTSGFNPPSAISSNKLRVALGIATRGRPDVLKSTLLSLQHQSRMPDLVLISCTGISDVGDIQNHFPDVHILISEPGLTRQRNTILDRLPDVDLIIFMDDDFYLHSEYLKVMENVFMANPDVVVATGTVLGDGIHGTALTPSDADLLFASRNLEQAPLALYPVFNAYGCNMLFRMEIIRKHFIRFDENLPLYGWYEDVDFSRQVSRYGRTVRVSNAWGVHLGVKSGRHSEVRLGYSQVANPIYLAKKKSVPWRFAIASLCSRSLKNFVRSFAPESHIDRRGRLRGNLRAFRDLCKGMLNPTRVNEM
jgi:GT2 family glycosyltransferase